MRTLRVLGTSTLSVVSAFTLCVRSGCLPLTDHAPESPLRLSPNSHSTVALSGLSMPITAIRHRFSHFALDPLTYRCLLSLSSAADFAEPRPPRHTQYLDFFAPSDSRFSNSCISVKYCPFLTNIHQWKYYLISFQMIRTHMTYGFVVQGHISVRYSQVLI